MFMMQLKHVIINNVLDYYKPFLKMFHLRNVCFEFYQFAEWVPSSLCLFLCTSYSFHYVDNVCKIGACNPGMGIDQYKQNGRF